MSGSRDYSPINAVRALVDTAKRNQPKIVSSNVPGLVDRSGEQYHAPPKVAVDVLCVMVKALVDGSADLPDDFAGVSRMKGDLEAHVRPDGSVFLGWFGNSPETAALVYGPPDLSKRQVQQIAADFIARQRAPLEIVS